MKKYILPICVIVSIAFLSCRKEPTVKVYPPMVDEMELYKQAFKDTVMVKPNMIDTIAKDSVTVYGKFGNESIKVKFSLDEVGYAPYPDLRCKISYSKAGLPITAYKVAPVEINSLRAYILTEKSTSIRWMLGSLKYGFKYTSPITLVSDTVKISATFHIKMKN